VGRPLPAGLAHALDGARVEPALAALLAPELEAGTRVRGVTSSIVRRRVLRYEVELEGPDSPAPLRLIGKVYESRAAGERGFAALRWLCEQDFAARAPTRVTLPRPVAYLSEFSLLLMEEAGGESLQRLLKDERATPAHLALFAQALRKLHELPASFGAPYTLADHLAQRCAGLTAPLVSAFPELERPIARLLARARRAEHDELAPTSRVAHGDYHPGQVHLDGERLWLVDLDPLHQGNPAYDVAMVLFALRRLETTPEQERRIAPLRASFLSCYYESVAPRAAARVPLDVALIYLKRACKRFRYQDEDGWPDAVRAQIRLAERCLDWLEETRSCDSLADVLALGERCPG